MLQFVLGSRMHFLGIQPLSLSFVLPPSMAAIWESLARRLSAQTCPTRRRRSAICHDAPGPFLPSRRIIHYVTPIESQVYIPSDGQAHARLPPSRSTRLNWSYLHSVSSK